MSCVFSAFSPLSSSCSVTISSTFGVPESEMSCQRFFGGLRATLKRLSLPAGVFSPSSSESAQIDVDSCFVDMSITLALR